MDDNTIAQLEAAVTGAVTRAIEGPAVREMIFDAVTRAVEGPTVRAMIFDSVTGAVGGLQKHLDAQIRELRTDLAIGLDKLDAIGVQLGELVPRVDRLETAVRELNTQLRELPLVPA